MAWLHANQETDIRIIVATRQCRTCKQYLDPFRADAVVLRPSSDIYVLGGERKPGFGGDMSDLYSNATCGRNLLEMSFELLCQCSHDCSAEAP